jgi:hypothetical protein
MCFSKLKGASLVLLAISLSACSGDLEEAFRNTDEFIVQIHHSGKNVKEYKIKRGTEKFIQFKKWTQENEWGWSLTPATYLPGVVVRGGDYVFNFIGDAVILNNADGQYSKDIRKSEYEYLL